MTGVDPLPAGGAVRGGPIGRALASPWFQRRALLILYVAAAAGFLVGIYATYIHLRDDPLADVHAYYDAGARLNAGEPLYNSGGDYDIQRLYLYPPLLAIVFRPLALFPYDVVAPLWGLAMLGAFLLTVRRIGTGRNALIALGLFALPAGWSLAIGQAQVLVTLLSALGSPWAVALAANLKVFPALIGLYWLARHDWRALKRFVTWGLAILAVQLVLEPTGTLGYLGFLLGKQAGQVYNISPFAWSPVLWLALVVAGYVAVVLLARTRVGWAAAVAFSVLATPRLVPYQFMTLLAAVRAPDEPGDGEPKSAEPPKGDRLRLRL